MARTSGRCGRSAVADLAGKRVALVLATSTGGVGRHVRTLAAGLPAHGVRVRVLGPAATEDLFGFTGAGAEFVAVEIGSRPGPRAVGALRRLQSGLCDTDVVHAHGLRAGLLAGVAVSRRAPYVVTRHNAVLGGGPRRRLVTPLEVAVARRACVTLAVSADLADRVRQVGGRDVRVLAVPAPRLPSGVAAAAGVRADLGAGERPLVLAVGRLHAQKGFDTLVAAAGRWARRTPPPVVAIAGEGPDRPRLAALVAANGSDVRLLGYRADVSGLLAAADVVVLPSQWEGSPLAAQEALAAGRPLVATAVGGVPDLVGDGAVLVAPDDPAALAAAVAVLLDDPAAGVALAARGVARAATWPDEAATAAAAARVYAELLGRRGGR